MLSRYFVDKIQRHFYTLRMETTLKPKKKQTGIRLTPELVRDLKHLAADTEKSLSALVEEAVQDLLLKYAQK